VFLVYVVFYQYCHVALQRIDGSRILVVEGVVSTRPSTIKLNFLSLAIFYTTPTRTALLQAEISSVRSRSAESAQALLDAHRKESAETLVLHSVSQRTASRFCAAVSLLLYNPSDYD
jgi:hypothetical protein